MANGYIPGTTNGILVGDDVSGATPAPTKINGAPISAAIEVKSTTRGNVPPRMTEAQINAIQTPTPGMYAFNTDKQVLAVYTTNGWIDQTGPTGAQYMSGTLTAAQIRSMYTNAISLIPTRGANKAIIVQGWSLELDSDGTAFDNGGDIYLQYTTAGHGAAPVTTTIAGTLLENTADRFSYAPGLIVSVAPINYVDKPIAITNATGVFTLGGNSTVNWKVWFLVVPTA